MTGRRGARCGLLSAVCAKPHAAPLFGVSTLQRVKPRSCSGDDAAGLALLQRLRAHKIGERASRVGEQGDPVLVGEARQKRWFSQKFHRPFVACPRALIALD